MAKKLPNVTVSDHRNVFSGSPGRRAEVSLDWDWQNSVTNFSGDYGPVIKALGKSEAEAKAKLADNLERFASDLECVITQARLVATHIRNGLASG